MTHNELAFLGIFGLGAAILVYVAMNQTGDRAVPQVQTEAQVMGMGVQAGMRLNANTVLDLRPEMHFHVPGYDPDPSATGTAKMRLRYPALPGGNMSTVMHRGFSSFTEMSPADNDWRITPPEAAVL